MPFDDIRAALVALLSQPVAVVSVVFLTGVHAALWLLVFERVGFPPALASLLLVPPLTFLLPLYVVLARWPSQRVVRFTKPRRSARSRSSQRAAQNQLRGPVLGGFHIHRPLRLDSNGLPKFRIPLLPPPPPSERPARDYLREVESRYLHY